MPLIRQRGTKVVYVARSARDLPADVQTWLSRADNRATASQDLYDLMSKLANGARPSAIIVHMGTVDWDEMEFFDLVRRVSPETSLYVTGQDHLREKLNEACDRGATVFDISLLDDDMQRPARLVAVSGLSDLIAGEAAPATTKPAQPKLQPVREIEVEFKRGTPNFFSQPEVKEQTVHEEIIVKDPTNEDAIAEVAITEDVDDVIVDEQVIDESLTDEEIIEEQSRRFNMRLVEPEYARREQTDRPVPFPWRPAEHRPARKPPTQSASASEAVTNDSTEPTVEPLSQQNNQSQPEQPQRHTVDLTKDELSALLGRPSKAENNETTPDPYDDDTPLRERSS